MNEINRTTRLSARMRSKSSLAWSSFSFRLIPLPTPHRRHVVCLGSRQIITGHFLFVSLDFPHFPVRRARIETCPARRQSDLECLIIFFGLVVHKIYSRKKMGSG